MIKSIRYFLLISLLISITLASAINGIGNYLLDEQVVQPYLDAQLIRFASLVDILQESTHANTEFRKNIINYLMQRQALTGQKFMFQVWDKNGVLVMHSPNQFNISLRDAPLGFSDQVIQNNDWRIYAMYNNKNTDEKCSGRTL